MRRPDITLDQRGLAWLATIAIHHAWHQTQRSTGEIPIGGFQAGTSGRDREPHEPPHPDARSAEDRALANIEHRERVELVKTLKPREPGSSSNGAEMVVKR